MKLTVKIALAAILSSSLLTSCKKGFLDVDPDNRTYINNLDKLSQLVGTAYPEYDYFTFTETASDNAEDKGPGVGSISDLLTAYYTWQDYGSSGTNTSGQYWNGCYTGIASANQALESIETENMGNDALPYKGEALVARAYAHHMLSIFFAQPFKAGGDNSSPGVPYVTKPEKTLLANYERGTVQTTYDNIEKDLLEGISLIDDSKYKVPKYHFTKAAAHAFAARFYLFKNDWQKVIDHANLVVPGGDYSNYLRPIAGAFRSVGSGQYNIDFTKTDVKAHLLMATNYSTYQRIYTSPRYGYGPTLTNMFTAGGNPTGKALANWVLSYGNGNYTTYKWKEYFFYTTPSTGYPYLQSVLLTTDEALMNRAEAYAELGQFDLALKDINTFYSVRITGYNPAVDVLTMDKLKTYFLTTDNKETIIKAVLAAKKAEFLQEGMRWLDIVRRGLTVKKPLYSATGLETTLELKPDDLRRVFQIPEEALLAGVELNPR